MIENTVTEKSPNKQSPPLLEVRGLKKYFTARKRTFKAVDGVSFSIQKGEAFGLVGESGCGKTTTGRCIVGLYEPTEGEILFNGERIGAGTRSRIKSWGERAQEKRAKKEMARVRRKIQMIFQDPVACLNPRMTVREIVAEGLIVAGERDGERLTERVQDALKKVGLSREHAGRYPHEFSGGQRQRIGIARALITSPELVIADEPVSALDVSVQAQVINLLQDLREELGLTVLFIAHDLSVVKHLCDRIGVMYKGRLVEVASSDRLFENPLHPYTKALLSAIPLPDPKYEKGRNRVMFEGTQQPQGELIEAEEGHFVLTEAEK